MTTKHFNYFDDYKSLILECPTCHWKGIFEQGSVETYDDLTDCACPQCDVFQAPILAEVLYPTTEELVANADRPGVGDWIVMAEKAIEAYQGEQPAEIDEGKLTQGAETDSSSQKPTAAETALEVATQDDLGATEVEPAMQMHLFTRPDQKPSGPVLNLRAHGPMRPVPGVPGAYWERTETGTTLGSIPNPEWDKLPPEEQQSITHRMMKCCALAQHLDRVTALRDEFTKIAREETCSSDTKLTEGKPEREMDRKMNEQEDDPLIGDFNLDEEYRARIRNSNTPEALAELKAAGIDLKGQQPVVHILGGGAFTGKTTTELVRSLAELPDAVVINTDIFMEGIPEYQIMKKSDPLGAARRAQGEASGMAKEATTRSVQHRRNLILDKVSGDPLKLRADMEAFKRAGYWVELRFVDRPLEVALPGMVTRFEKTGQWVPASNVERGHFGAAAAFHQNKDFADRAILRMAAAGEQHQLVYSQGRKREGM
jgi:predicted ABC-type ATPase